MGMNVSLGKRSGNNGSSSALVHRRLGRLISHSREEERCLIFVFGYLCRRSIVMILGVLALLIIAYGYCTVIKDNTNWNINERIGKYGPYGGKSRKDPSRVDQNSSIRKTGYGNHVNAQPPPPLIKGKSHKVFDFCPPPPSDDSALVDQNSSVPNTRKGSHVYTQPPPPPPTPLIKGKSHERFDFPPPPSNDSTLVDRNSSVQNTGKGSHVTTQPPPLPLIKGKSPCETFTFPPPPPPNGKRLGPRACPVCYFPVEQAISSMPNSPSVSPMLSNLEYVKDENPIPTEQHGGYEFGGYPSLKQRNDSFDIKESMTVHCGFVKGSKRGHHSGFDIDEVDWIELEQAHDVIVASAIFGNYDIIQKPENISEEAMKNVPFYMFIDEETEAYLRNSSVLGDSKRVGLWRIIVVHNLPYTDPRRNGKIPKLLLHRIFPNVKYSIWIDGKLQLVVDPYQILERFLWRQSVSFAISKHYTRFDVFAEAEANKVAGKYDNASIDYQIEFYKNEGLTPYSPAKLPITSDVPEGCVIIREHIPITNLFSCLWFNEIDRFTSRDQLSFSTMRDKIMAKVNWRTNMFLDCERRNFVIQTYHRGVKPSHLSVSRYPPLPPVTPTTSKITHNVPTGVSRAINNCPPPFSGAKWRKVLTNQ